LIIKSVENKYLKLPLRLATPFGLNFCCSGSDITKYKKDAYASLAL
jgi:hypothetical protein